MSGPEKHYSFPLKDPPASVIFIHTITLTSLYEDIFDSLSVLNILRNRDIKTTLLFTYFPFLRGVGKGESGEISFQTYLKSILSFGVKKIYVLDPHIQSPPLIPISLDKICERLNTYDMLVLPDQGAKMRYQDILEKFSLPHITLEKKRNGETLHVMSSLAQKLKDKSCLVMDDMVDSGKTMEASVNFCITHGARTVKTYATHHLGSDYPLDYSTNSLGQRASEHIFDLSEVIAAFLSQQ